VPNYMRPLRIGGVLSFQEKKIPANVDKMM